MAEKSTARPEAYTEFHPRWHRARVSTFWWLGQWQYLKFILREISSIFVALAVALTLAQIYALRQGPEAYAQLQQALRSPLAILVNAVAFLFVVFHAVTWFNLAPKAMLLRWRGKRLPDALVAGPNYAAWLVISAAIAWLVLRG